MKAGMPAQVRLREASLLPSSAEKQSVSSDNRVSEADRGAHRWYRFVLSFPPHLVRNYVREFGLNGSSVLLDPFCGTGTALVEAKKLGVPSKGIEAHPFTAFAASVKVDWSPDPVELLEHAQGIAKEARSQIGRAHV